MKTKNYEDELYEQKDHMNQTRRGARREGQRKCKKEKTLKPRIHDCVYATQIITVNKTEEKN